MPLNTTVAILKRRIAETLDREDLDAYIETFLQQAHHELQQQRDWNIQTSLYRVLTSTVTTTIPLPADFKSAFGPLWMMDGTDLTAKVVPSQTYALVDYNAILVDRGESFDVTEFAIFGDVIHLEPTAPAVGAQFVFPYYAMLDLPAEEEANWFTRHCFSYLIYEALLMAVPFLGGNDDRVVAWTTLRDRSLQWAIASDIGRTIGGAELVLRG